MARMNRGCYASVVVAANLTRGVLVATLFLAAPLTGQTAIGVDGVDATPLVTVAPACPVSGFGTRRNGNRDHQFTIAYDPRNVHAVIKRPQRATLRIAFNGPEFRNSIRTIPLHQRKDGTWAADVPLEPAWSYAIWYVRDEATGVRDDNAGQYWDMLFCDANGKTVMQGALYRARSYAGTIFSEDIKRATDYRRAIEITEASRPQFGSALLYEEWYFKFRLSSKSSQAAPELVAEIENGINAHASDIGYVRNTTQFLVIFRKAFPTTLVERAVDLADHLSPQPGMRRDLEREEAEGVADPRKEVSALREWLSKYPDDPFYGIEVRKTLLDVLRDLKDVSSAEGSFKELIQRVPDDADAYATLASIYILSGVKLDDALALLDEAEKRLNATPSTGSGFVVTLHDSEQNASRIALWRGRALMAQQNWAAAEKWLTKAVELDSPEVYALLARAQEQQKKWLEAKNNCLRAAIQDSKQQQRYIENFVTLSLKTGTPTREAAMKEFASAQKRSFDLEHYVPSLVDLPAPDFSFTTLAGAKVSPSSLRGHVVILNLWATWCSPCVAELAGFERLRIRHPEIIVLTVAENSTPADVQKVRKDQGLAKQAIAISDDENAARFGSNGVPQTYLIDSSGRIRTVHYGGLSDVVRYLEADLTALRQAQR